MFISIIIPVYNSVKYIKSCLDSILSQDFFDYEIILVDDGSTDGSECVVDSYKKENVIVIHQKNQGPAHARNVGLNKAKGKYVWFVDSDDEIEKDSLEFLHRIIRIKDVDLVLFGYREIYNNESQVTLRYKSGLYENDKLDHLKHNLIKNTYDNLTTCWMHIYKREMLTGITFEDHSKVAYEDALFCINAFIKANDIRVVNDIYYQYYYRDNSQHTTIRQSLWYQAYCYSNIRERFYNSELFNKFKNDLLYLFLDKSYLGLNGEVPSVFICEYMNNKKDSHEIVKKILTSKEMKNMLLDAKEYVNGSISKDIYNLMINEDEIGLYHYLGKLAIEKQSKNNDIKNNA